MCLAEAALHSGCGATLELPDDPFDLFGEVGGRAVVSCSPETADSLRGLALELEVPLDVCGVVGGATLFGVELAQLRRAWEVDL